MVRPEDRPETGDPVLRDALDWVGKLLSGAATVADAEALAAWRARSPAHETAFVEAVRLRGALRGAAEEFAAGQSVPFVRRPAIGRRALFGGALAAAAAGTLIVHPVFSLWPSLEELRADYRTAPGGRHLVELDGGGKVEMNTRTSLAYEREGDSRHVVLVAGEAVVTVPAGSGGPLEMAAAGGRTIADAARFSLRHTGSSVLVTGLEGEIRVEAAGDAVSLPAGGQVSYDRRGLGRPVEVDTSVVTAWQRGLLIFRGTPLGGVVEEVNRYRAGGRIIVTDADLAQRPVNAIFHLDQIDGVVAQIEKMGARATRLPGDVVLLG